MNPAAMRRAFERKDPAFDGVFYVAVKTTGIFCRPVCRARMPRAENVEFFPTVREATRAGYRACKRCRPLDLRPPAVVARLLAAAERDGRVDLARLGVDDSTARRAFRRWCGMTFRQYERARRLGAARSRLRKGAKVIEAQLEGGYGSGSGFRTAFAKVFGRAPVRAEAPPVVSARIETPLGPMIATANDEGVLSLDWDAPMGVPGTNAHLERLRRELNEYFAGTRRDFEVPLVLQGTSFQRRAWEFLRTIPYGETRSYADEARAIGSPAAVRAVGRANGSNRIAILVPCHRVIASDGTLAGYGGGLARKRWLLEHERRA